MTLESTKYSILFDFGLVAIMDGYYREAVSSIAASLERLYEFFIRVVCTKHDIPFKYVEENWAHVAKQSERQLGVTTGLASPSFPYFAVEPLVFLRHVEVPEGIPLAIEVGGS